MSDPVIVALIGLSGTLGGVIVTLLLANWRNHADINERNHSAVTDFYKGELSHCRQSENMWRDLALKNLGGMEEAAKVFRKQQTGGQS